MKKIGFIGAYDKMDMIMYIAKILTTFGKKTLIIDATYLGKARYIVPAINPSPKYITEFEQIDVAVGIYSVGELQQYLINTGVKKFEYDYMFIDTDNSKGVNNFDLSSSDKNYFVTSLGLYSLKKGLEALIGLQNNINLTKVYFTQQTIKEEDDYLNFLSSGYNITWNEHRIYFPIENGDLNVIYENQRIEKIKLKKLSVQFKDGLEYIAEELLGDVNGSQIRKVIKNI